MRTILQQINEINEEMKGVRTFRGLTEIIEKRTEEDNAMDYYIDWYLDNSNIDDNFTTISCKLKDEYNDEEVQVHIVVKFKKADTDFIVRAFKTFNSLTCDICDRCECFGFDSYSDIGKIEQALVEKILYDVEFDLAYVDIIS